MTLQQQGRNTAAEEINQGIHGRVTHKNSGNSFAIIISALALIVSSISLYYSVLKRPEFHIYIPKNLLYRQDTDGTEIFVIPITVANHGSRDGAVVDFKMTVMEGGKTKGKTAVYSARYFADEDYFAGANTINKNTKQPEKRERPKSPFAPISVSGHTAYSNTILFYPADEDRNQLITQGGRYLITIEATTHFNKDLGVVDEWLQGEIKPISFEVELDKYDSEKLFYGNTLTLKRVK